MTCTGRGDADGGHCCWINGTICQFLLPDRPPRCGKWDMMADKEWQKSPVGRMFAQRWPGRDCKDWPQNIPAVMAKGVGLCCWGD